MVEKIKKNDFVELEFIGRVKNRDIFDTNIKQEALKIGLEIETRPLVIVIGQGMILPPIDKFLEGKELGKYSLELAPENAFGWRDAKMIKTMPIKIFHEKQISPQPGMVFQFDTLLGRVSAVSGGRVIVDFNNPLASKEVVYELNAKRIVRGAHEKAEILINFFFRRKLNFEIKEGKLIIEAEKQFAPLVEFYKPKFKEMLSLDLETKEIEKKKEEKPQFEQKLGKVSQDVRDTSYL